MDDAVTLALQPLPNLSSNIFEFSTYIVGSMVLIAAFRRARWDGMLILTAMVCGCLLELTGMRTSHLYSYGNFHWMIGSGPTAVPACIAIAWGCITYSVMRTTELLPLSLAQRPLVCAMLALVLDLALDPVASNSRILTIVKGVPFHGCLDPRLPVGDAPGLPFWTWCKDPRYDTYTWYGVPLGNFLGWMIAIAGFTTAILLVERRWPVRQLRLAKQLACLGVLAAVGGVLTFSILGFYDLLAFVIRMPEWLIFALGFGAPLIVTAQMLPRVRRNAALEWMPLAMPTLALGFCAFALFATDAERLRQATYAWTLATVTPLSLYLYLLPYRLGGATSESREPR
jgi:uncharacterized membrane protein